MQMVGPKLLRVHDNDKPMKKVQTWSDRRPDEEDEVEGEDGDGKSDEDSLESVVRNQLGSCLADTQDDYSTGHSKMYKVNCEVQTTFFLAWNSFLVFCIE